MLDSNTASSSWYNKREHKRRPDRLIFPQCECANLNLPCRLEHSALSCCVNNNTGFIAGPRRFGFSPGRRGRCRHSRTGGSFVSTLEYINGERSDRAALYAAPWEVCCTCPWEISKNMGIADAKDLLKITPNKFHQGSISVRFQLISSFQVVAQSGN